MLGKKRLKKEVSGGDPETDVSSGSHWRRNSKVKLERVGDDLWNDPKGSRTEAQWEVLPNYCLKAVSLRRVEVLKLGIWKFLLQQQIQTLGEKDNKTIAVEQKVLNDDVL